MNKKVKKQKTIEDLLGEALVPKEEQPYEVPNNWVWTDVKSLLETMNSRDPKKLQGDYFYYIDVASIDNKRQKLKEKKLLDISAAPSRAKREVRYGDVIISLVRPYLMNLAHIEETDENIVASTAFYVCRNHKALVPKFLYNYLRSPIATSFLNEHTKGDNSPSVKSTDFKKMPVAFPPLKEQKRIAEKVEHFLNKIDEAKQLIDEAKETFELRRAAILDKAFRGELTSKWREEHPNVESANERYGRIKEERLEIVESKRELSEVTKMFNEFNFEKGVDNKNWLFLKSNMFCHNINCGGTPSKDISENGEVPFLKVYNIVNNKVAFNYRTQYIPKSVHETKLKKSKLQARDVIMNIVGPPLRKIAIIPEQYPELNMNQAIVRFRPIEYVLPKYLYYGLQYDETLKIVINETRGVVGQSNISVSQSRNLVMPIPTIKEQAEIVKKVEILLGREEKAYEFISDSTNLGELKQSILSKAFRGELGTNDPREESAIELLKEVLQEQVQ